MTTRKRAGRGESVAFDYIRSPFFRVVHSNGAWGGMTPRRELSVTFYSERRAPPRRVTHSVTSGGLGPEISRDGTTNVQREFEVEVLMSMEEAVSLYEWLGDKIAQWRKTDLSIPQQDPPEAS